MCSTQRYPAPFHSGWIMDSMALSLFERQNIYAVSVIRLVTMQGGALDVLAAMADIEVSKDCLE